VDRMRAKPYRAHSATLRLSSILDTGSGRSVAGRTGLRAFPYRGEG
jgi:hypothetical protein